jgi:hypothetical protein
MRIRPNRCCGPHVDRRCRAVEACALVWVTAATQGRPLSRGLPAVEAGPQVDRRKQGPLCLPGPPLQNEEAVACTYWRFVATQV